MLGGVVSAAALHRFGVSAAATVTDNYDTGSQDARNETIYGHHLVIRAPDGRSVESYFSDDQMAVYPFVGFQPSQGDVFTVRYLPRHPHELAIVADDGSPWALTTRCNQLHGVMAMIAARAGFTHAAVDQAAVTAMEAKAQAAGCS